MKKIICIVCIGIVSILLPVAAVHACCGMIPEITDDPILTSCMGDVTISGTVKLSIDPGILMYWPEMSIPTVTIEITTPSGIVEAPIAANVDNLQEFGDIGPPDTRYAIYDFSATYTPTEAGTYTYVKTAVEGWLGTTVSASGEFTVCPCNGVDIKPCSCPNPINLKDKSKKGVIPVAILGSDVFDVTTIDLSSILMEGVAPIKVEIEDVANAPMLVDDVWGCGGDGYLDVICHFRTVDLRGPLDDSSTEATVTWTLLDGTPGEGTDSVKITQY